MPVLLYWSNPKGKHPAPNPILTNEVLDIEKIGSILSNKADLIHDPIETHIVFDKFDINSYDLKKAISNDKKQKMLNSTRIIDKSKLKFL